jgi:hypothetical protein
MPPEEGEDEVYLGFRRCQVISVTNLEVFISFHSQHHHLFVYNDS